MKTHHQISEPPKLLSTLTTLLPSVSDLPTCCYPRVVREWDVLLVVHLSANNPFVNLSRTRKTFPKQPRPRCLIGSKFNAQGARGSGSLFEGKRGFRHELVIAGTAGLVEEDDAGERAGGDVSEKGRVFRPLPILPEPSQTTRT